MATFPTYAKLLFNGFAVEQAPAVRRTNMESGPPKQAKILSRVMVTRAVTYKISSAADYTSFMVWFNTTLGYGVSWFDWTDPVDSVVKTARIVDGKIKCVPVVKTLAEWDIHFNLETWSA